MATVGDNGKVKGGVVRYHAERALEAIRFVDGLQPGDHTRLTSESGVTFREDLTRPDSGIGVMLDTLAYDHAREAASAARRGRNGNLAWKRRRARA
jgi:hypothetical protein